ncbi:dephospho-CoA kinase [Porticoccus sp.]
MTSSPSKKSSTLTIGLTGGIGSGKSVVANEFRKLGIAVIDADQAARQAVEPGSEALQGIVAQFGAAALLADGTLDRAYLRQKVFADPAQRQWLEALLHPIIQQLILESLSLETGPYTVLESPLLLETDQHALVDRVLVVDTSEALQISRACRRDNNTKSQIRAIIDSQMSREERLKRADDVLDNSGAIDDLGEAVARLHRHYLNLAGQADCAN